MKVEEKLIPYCAINQSVIKILVGAIILYDNTQDAILKDYDIRRGECSE